MRVDLSRGAAVGALAAFSVVVVETALEVPRVAGEGAATVLAYLAICAALATFAAAFAIVFLGVLTALAHAARIAASGREAARAWTGLFAVDRARAAKASAAPALVHSAAVSCGAFVALTTLTVSHLAESYNEPRLIGLVAAVASLAWIAVSAGLGLTVFALLGGVESPGRVRLLPRTRASFDPFASARAAIALWLALAWVVALVGLEIWPRFAMVFPMRLAASLTLFALLALEGPRIAAFLCTATGRPRTPAIAAAIALLAVTVFAMVWVEDPAARRSVIRSPTLSFLVDGVRFTTDFDRDGYGSLLGEGDCAPFDSRIHPGAVDVPGDGIDQNCLGGDFVPGERPSPEPDAPLPAHLARDDYSILLVTIDALRYDRTGAAGFELPATPNLDALAERGAWFERFYSTSSHTKDVLPTLVASGFAEELPLGGRIGTGGPGMPDRLLPEAVTLAEVLRRAGYRTGMFTGFGYFDGWDLDQGVEKSVNLENQRPVYETAPELTERAIAWLESLPEGARWFLWLHYMEPHYPYVQHPGSTSFGTSEKQRYAGEVRFADDQLGRWLRWLNEDPRRTERTIIAVTSDHGEELGERGRYGHALAMWDYLLHVPLVVAVPGASPQRVETPASTIDIAPTLAALAGVAPDPSWTGRAHVAGITLGRNDDDHVVFAAERESKQYAAIAVGWKLIRDERRNLEQLVDLERDAREERDASDEEPAVYQRLRQAMIQWRERVLGAELER